MEIEEAYADAAIAHGLGMGNSNHVSANKAADRLLKLRNELYLLPDRGESVLTRLVSHQDSSVVRWAASHLLPVNEKVAVAILERIAAEDKGIGGFDAEMMLRQWRSRH